VRLGIITPLVLQIVAGLCEIALIRGNDFGNPYLTVSPWRPLWIVVLPVLWIAVLHSPRIAKFCESRDVHPTTE
jgi:hypothetical protein